MSFFIAANTDAANEGNAHLIDALTDPDTLMRANPEVYGPRFQAIADLRAQDDGTGHKGQEFRRVASLTNVPLLKAIQIVDANFLKSKKGFYEWLDRGNNRAYCTYDRRNGGRMTERDRLKLPLSALGLDYLGGPDTLHELEVSPVTEAASG